MHEMLTGKNPHDKLSKFTTFAPLGAHKLIDCFAKFSTDPENLNGLFAK